MDDHADGTTLLALVDAATSRGDWQGAYALLAKADAETPLRGAGLAAFADVAYAAGHLGETISAWERAHADGVREGDTLAAAGAAVRIALHLLFDTALMSPIRAWTSRAERLLEGLEDTPIHAWLAVARTYERMLSGDVEAARGWAARAIATGTSLAPAAAAIGRVAEARSLILEGDVAVGLALLNEAAVATTSGELDPMSTGIVYCELVCALQGLAQYDLAEEWTGAMELWHRGQPVGSVHGRCRVHRAEILRLRGAGAEAEQEALLACAELRPYLRRELGWPLTELGRIRLQQGDIAGAEEAFLEAHEAGWDPQPGLALLRLAQGDGALAVGSIRDALDHPVNVPSKELPPNNGLRRAPLLAAQVEIELAAGDLERARSAADELRDVSTVFASTALTASALLADGRVLLAGGDADAACAKLQSAVVAWSDVGAPFETARARMILALACRMEGNEARAILEFRAAQSSFSRMGAVRDATLAANACEGAVPAPGPTSAAGPGPAPAPALSRQEFQREGDYWAVTFDGRTVRLRDRKGLQYLAGLLAASGREIHALDLVLGSHGGDAPGSHLGERVAVRRDMDAGDLLDAEARDAYRRRLTEVAEDIEEAERMGDGERAAQAAAERDFLVRELTRAFGLDGRSRRAGSSSERARTSVTRALRQALAHLSQHHPSLGRHLDRTVRTGTWCSYVPDPRAAEEWVVVVH